MTAGTGKKLIVALCAGAFTGLFLGDRAEIFELFGKIYFLATQAAIIPFLVSSLLLGLGKLSSAQAIKLFKSSWKIFGLIWLATVLVLFTLSALIPPSEVNVIRHESAGSTTKIIESLMKLAIPANPFASITDNHIPAIVIFCIAFGIALQSLGNKQKLLDVLELVSNASCKFWEWLVALLPLAMFAFSASLFGTVEFHSFPQILYYLVIVLAGSGLLIFWLFPAIAGSLIGMPASHVLKRLKDPMTIALVTNSSPMALPATQRMTAKLLSTRVHDPLAPEVILTTLSIAFVFMRCGELIDHVFISFAAYFYREPLSFLLNLALLPISIFSSIGGAGPILISSLNSYGLSLQLPAASTLLYSQTLAVAEYPITVVSTASTAVATLLATMNYYGVLRVDRRRLLTAFGLSLPVLAVMGLAVYQVGARLQTSANTPMLSQGLEPQLTEDVSVIVFKPGEAVSESVLALQNTLRDRSAMERIQKTGTLFVGYNPASVPFCYFNNQGDLVGYDIAFLYELARDLRVNLVFIPYRPQTLVEDLRSHRFDIACSAIYLTVELAAKTLPSTPYFKTEAALFGAPSRLQSAMEAKRPLNLKLLGSPGVVNAATRMFPGWTQQQVESFYPISELGADEVGFWGLEEASAIADILPGVAAMEVRKRSAPFLLSFLMPEDAQSLSRIVNYQVNSWLIKGEEHQVYRDWILGEGAFERKPRWSILTDVLGF